MSKYMLVADFNFSYEVKYFRKFERAVESFASQEAAEARYVELVNGGQYDAVYLYCDGRILEAWAENYDEPEGGHFEEQRYLKMIPNRFVVREEHPDRTLTDPHSVEDRRYPAYRSNYVVIDTEDGGAANLYGQPYMTNVSLDVADHLADVYNALYRLWCVAKAAHQVSAEGDASFAREFLVDGLALVGDFFEVEK